MFLAKTRFIVSCWIGLFLCGACFENASAQSRREQRVEQARLRGSITPERAWWDLRHYALAINVNIEEKSIEGSNTMRFKVLESGQRMQMDLQQPLEIKSVRHRNHDLTFERNGNVYLIDFKQPLEAGATDEIRIEYGGRPVESRNPPWSGGITWTQDSEGQPFIATSCQGIGASIWWPCKDHGYDEPDEGVTIAITVPESLAAVANGRLQRTEHDEEAQTKTFHWLVTQPINSYSINMNIGNYVSFSEVYEGEFGKLDMEYWVLDHQREKALVHFKEAPRTIQAFEHWFGKYPFYEDSYKLVVVPYLGMEHQSSVTYGNGFQNGYRGSDLSGTGVGMKFDFIIVHESGHEWFGNNISMRDVADMWIHESFTNYSENLFVEYHFSKEEAEDYVIGCRKRTLNDSPIIGKYDLNQSGSGDMYYKGGNVLHTLRHMIDDDEKWRAILRGLNQTFWHQTVTTQQIEDYLSTQSGLDLKPFFDQYLRTTKIPVFEYEVAGNRLKYRFVNAVDGFAMPLKLAINDQPIKLNTTEAWQTWESKNAIESVVVNRNFFVDSRPVVDATPTEQDQIVPVEPGKQIEASLKLSDGESIDYLIYAPANYDANGSEPVPMLLFLHGRGESNGPLSKVTTWGPPRMVARGDHFPFMVVSPQCPASDHWGSEKQLQYLTELLDDLTRHHKVDHARIYLSGLSMGGYGSWALAAKHPQRFAAVIPICGGGNPGHAEQLKDIPIWVFHGNDDRVVPLQRSTEMVEAIQRAGGSQIRYTTLEHIGHASWAAAYESPDVYGWMLKQTLE